MLVVDVFEDNDRMTAWVPQEQNAEVRRAHRQYQLVGRKVVVTTRDCHVDKELSAKTCIFLLSTK